MQHKPCGSSRDASAQSAYKQNEKQSCEEERNQPEPLLHILHVLLHRMECCLCANLISPAYVNPNHRSFQSKPSNSGLKHICEMGLWSQHVEEELTDPPDDG